MKVADTESNTIIAYGRWEFPVADEAEQPDSDPHATGKIPEVPFPEYANEKLIDDYVEKTYSIRERLVGKSKDYGLQMLATHPAHQGKGAGSILIRYGLDAAERAGAKAFLEATPAAVGVYERYGWKGLDEIVMDLGDYGVENGGLHRTLCMERKAGS